MVYWYDLWHKSKRETSLGFWIPSSTYPYWTTPISGPAGPMSRAWATSVRNCFWIRNRRLPMPELPSIRNDKSTLQSEEQEKTPLLWLCLLLFAPLFLHQNPLRFQWKESKKYQDTGCIHLFLSVTDFHWASSSWMLGPGLISTTALEFSVAATITDFRSSDLPVQLGKALRMVSCAQTPRGGDPLRLSLWSLWLFTLILTF